MEHRPSVTASLTMRKHRTTAGGQFGWGGTPSKRYQGGPKIGSDGSEPRQRGQGQKPGLANLHVPTVGGWRRQKSYPRGNRLVAGESSYRPRGLVPHLWGMTAVMRVNSIGL